MKVIVSGKNLTVRDELKDAVEKKLAKFERFFRSEIEIQAVFSHRRTDQIVEVTIPLKNGVIFRAEEASNDMLTSIDRVVDRLGKQIKKHKTKIEKKYHKHESIRFDEIPDFEGAEPEHHVVRSKRFPVKPMDPEEAILQMEMLGHDFFVFLNYETEQVNVVYQRKDGDYGLIEPYM